MGYTILVVDDERASLRMLERLLRKEYRVLTAASGEEALDVLRQEPGDVALIITDQRMPGMSGTDLLRATLETHTDTTRIILTGYSEMEALVDAVNTSHIYKFLSKPWEPADLRVVVRDALHERQRRIDLRRLAADLATLARCHPYLLAATPGHEADLTRLVGDVTALVQAHARLLSPSPVGGPPALEGPPAAAAAPGPGLFP